MFSRALAAELAEQLAAAQAERQAKNSVHCSSASAGRQFPPSSGSGRHCVLGNLMICVLGMARAATGSSDGNELGPGTRFRRSRELARPASTDNSAYSAGLCAPGHRLDGARSAPARPPRGPGAAPLCEDRSELPALADEPPPSPAPSHSTILVIFSGWMDRRVHRHSPDRPDFSPIMAVSGY